MDRETYRQTELAKITADYGSPGGGGDDYDPHAHRDVPRGTTFVETMMHFLKGSLGTGILAMPIGFKYAGWFTGIIVGVIICFVCTYGILILVKSQYVLCKRLKSAYLPYPVAMRAALLYGPMLSCAYVGQVIVDVFLITYQTGVCCSYIVFVAENMKKLVEAHVDVDRSVEMYIVYTIVPFMLIMSVPDMKYMAPFSMLANILTFISCGILLSHIFVDMPAFSNMAVVGQASDLPLYVGTVLFSVAAIGVVTTSEKAMAKPGQFTDLWGVVNVSMLIITTMYIAMGFFGYWRHPEDIKPSITLNLDESRIEAKLIQCMYAFAVWVGYGLNGYVPVDIIWNNYLQYSFPDSKYRLVIEYAIRFAVVFFTILLSLSIPLLGEIISLFGALCMSGLQVIFPAVIHLFTHWNDDSKSLAFAAITDSLMIIVGLIGLCSGTYMSIHNIVIKLGDRGGSLRFDNEGNHDIMR